MDENLSKYIVCKMAASLSRPQRSKFFRLTERSIWISLYSPILIQSATVKNILLLLLKSICIINLGGMCLWKDRRVFTIFDCHIYIFPVEAAADIKGQNIALNVMKLVCFKHMWLQKLGLIAHHTLQFTWWNTIMKTAISVCWLSYVLLRIL